eukprot:763396-Hanusia_phi.AAC.5
MEKKPKEDKDKWKKECARILMRIWKHKDSWPFLEPVTVNLAAPCPLTSRPGGPRRIGRSHLL